MGQINVTLMQSNKNKEANFTPFCNKQRKIKMAKKTIKGKADQS